MRTRRPAVGGAAVLAAALAVTACAQEAPDDSAGTEPDGGGSEGQVELRFAWWGADLRHRLTQEVIDAFEAEHPGITITPEYSDWGGYWDRLATAGAAGDLPDVIQMDEKYLATYAAQGQLADLSTLDALDTSNIDPAALPAGETDGGLYALVTSVNTYSVVANADILAAAGVELPDDTTWTWDDLRDLSVAVGEGTGDGTYGLQHWGMEDGGLQVWARQHGESLWTEDGALGVSEETLAAWWEYVLELSSSGAMAPPSVVQEWVSSGQEQSGTATNAAALGTWWSNQYASLSASSGQDLELLRPPRTDPADAGTYYKPSMFWSVASGSEHPEEAALFVDFLVNSSTAGEILLAERGVPSNLQIREEITDRLTPEDQVVVEFITEVAGEVGPPPPMTAAGGADLETVLKRYTGEVLFGSLTPQDAAPAFIAEIEGMLG